jgi:hypothetical protein
MGYGGEAGCGGLPPHENEFQAFGKATMRSDGQRRSGLKSKKV